MVLGDPRVGAKACRGQPGDEKAQGCVLQRSGGQSIPPHAGSSHAGHGRGFAIGSLGTQARR